MRVTIVLIRLGLVLGAALMAGQVQAQTNDHLKCYQVKGDMIVGLKSQNGFVRAVRDGL